MFYHHLLYLYLFSNFIYRFSKLSRIFSRKKRGVAKYIKRISALTFSDINDPKICETLAKADQRHYEEVIDKFVANVAQIRLTKQIRKKRKVAQPRLGGYSGNVNEGRRMVGGPGCSGCCCIRETQDVGANLPVRNRKARLGAGQGADLSMSVVTPRLNTTADMSLPREEAWFPLTGQAWERLAEERPLLVLKVASKLAMLP